MKSPVSFLYPVFLQGHVKLIENVTVKSKTFSADTPVAYSIMTEEVLRQHIRRVRNELYNTVNSKAFREEFAIADEILGLNISNFKKVILILIVLEVSLEETYMIVLSSKESIMTIRSAFKKSYPQYFTK